MLFTSTILIAAMASLAQSQSVTPSGFTPSASSKLDVFFNTTMVMTPGQMLSKAETASQPRIAVSNTMANSSATYMFVMLDLDVPPEAGSTKRRVLLHAMNTGFKATKQKIGGSAMLLASSEKGPAAYIPPGPPPTDTIPHRYVQLLFQQPADLKIQASDFKETSARINFDINAFMAKNKVSAPMAGNFFMVDGRASSTAKGTASPRGSGGLPTSTVQPFTGAADKFRLPPATAGLLGVALLAFQM
ncbi:hypothetical protein N0V87_009734 [Didymella glomerata]|uniref:PEBP-like protein n=1 Tax=Didymella glomerata TaxID=749621 RepID=A0A9W8WQK6_9PLEO|nr:hypothetical protein N0V87_009734 [Didymella glomerata]